MGDEQAGDERDSAEFLTLRQASQLLNIPERTLRRHTDAGKIPVVRFGRTIRYRRAALLQLGLSTEDTPPD